MSTRIRYSVNGNVLTSKQAYQHPDNGGRFRVILDTTTNSYTIQDEMAEEAVSSGTAKNLHQLKIEAKKAMESLGVNFQKEERSERKTQLAV